MQAKYSLVAVFVASIVFFVYVFEEDINFPSSSSSEAAPQTSGIGRYDIVVGGNIKLSLYEYAYLGQRYVDTFVPELNDYHSNLAQGKYKCILDIGANIGSFSVLMASLFPSAQIFSFEPVGSTFKNLLINTQTFPNIHIFNYALGLRAEFVTFQVEPRHPQGNGDQSKGYPETTLVINSDSLKGLLNCEPDLIKMDCEGCEYKLAFDDWFWRPSIRVVGERHERWGYVLKEEELKKINERSSLPNVKLII